MKTVLVCAAQAPFITGGAEILVQELRDALVHRGFRVDVANVPFKWYPVSEIVRQALAWRLLDVTESNGTPIDLVIPTKFPSYLVKPPAQGGLALPPAPRGLRPVRHALLLVPRDAGGCAGARRDPHHGPGRPVRVPRDLHHLPERREPPVAATTTCPAPPCIPRRTTWAATRCREYGDFLFYAGRLDRLKRLDLAIDAMQRVRSGAKLKIAGAGPLQEELRKQIVGLGVEDRVELLGFVSASELIDLYSRCRAAYYAPLNEDYGYVTVEAFLSRKPVVTTTDAGGPLEFVTDGETGVVAEPTPESVADAIDRLWALPPARLAEMGDGGRARVADITWERVVDALTASIA